MTNQKPGLQIVPALTEEQDQKVSELLQAVTPVLQVSHTFFCGIACIISTSALKLYCNFWHQPCAAVCHKLIAAVSAVSKVHAW